MSKNKYKPYIDAKDLVKLIKASPTGVINRQHLHSRWQDVNRAVTQARNRQQIGTIDNLIYDLERLDKEAALTLYKQNGTLGLPNFVTLAREVLEQASVPALLKQEIERSIGSFFHMAMLTEDELAAAGIGLLELKLFPAYSDWYYLTSGSYDAAYDYALTEAEKRHEADWSQVLAWAGDELRQGASEGDSTRTKALARLYSRSQIASVMDMSERVFKAAIRKGILTTRVCPDGAKRIRAADLHRLRDDAGLRQQLEDQLEINIWQIRNLTDLKISYLRTLLHNAGLKPSSRSNQDGVNASVWYRWGDVRKVLWPIGDHPSVSDIDIIEQTDGAGREAWWSDYIIAIHEEIDRKKREQREARDRRRRERSEKREALRAQMIDNFPSWLREDEGEQIAYIHVGPTNSGKTHDALQELANAGSGWYLAPLRLLAREMFERLNQMGVYCNLLTGEERIDVPGAVTTAATVEMFNPNNSGECVIIDEAHMIGDHQRGWAWTQALINARAPQLRVITAPHGLGLLNRVFESVGVETQILYHQRLVPLEVCQRPWRLEELPPRTILIAFTRADVLRLKYILQHMGRSVSVVYGALPPEVRLKQAQRFADGTAEICVATDAVGMGLNLPADNVVFSTLTKFDGRQERRISVNELQQIAGRAGRYGLSERGFVNGIDQPMLDTIRKLMHQTVPDLEIGRIAPRTDEIELLEGDLSQRLITWRQLNAIPDELRSILTSTELDDRIELAKFLSYEDLVKLGVEKALTLVTAPTRAESQEYWVDCATAILRDEPLPLPPPPPITITEGKTLKHAEAVLACMDVYLWLGYRQPFQHLVENPQAIIEQRNELIREMDLALMRKFNPTSYIRYQQRNLWDDDF